MPQPPLPLSTVLVPTDFSAGADCALARALSLPLGSGARVHVVHVLPSELPAKLATAAVTAARRAMVGLVRTHRVRARSAGAELTGEVLRGDPRVEIERARRSLRADLVVLGRHGQRTLRDLVLGTTAERVVRDAQGPVLVVGRTGTAPYTRALVATDLEASALPSITAALRLVGLSAARVDVIHAYRPAFEGFVAPSLSTKERRAYGARFETQAKVALRAVLDQVGDRRCRGVVRRGDPRAVLLAEASKRRAELVVLAAQSRAGLAKLLVGSVATHVLRETPTDVLIVRPPQGPRR